jgi:hypothetical protein
MIMDKLKKFELMEKIGRELEDLQHSQTAVLQKIGKIEVDNMELNNAKLEDNSIASVLENFEEVKDTFEDKNNIAGLRDQENLDSIK